MHQAVRIVGDGVAARTLGHLLRSAGIPLRWEATRRPPLPTILLSEATRTILRDVFGRPDLLSSLAAVTSREVKWRTEDPSRIFDHLAYTTSEKELLGALPEPNNEDCEAPFAVYTQRPLPDGVIERRFGDRDATLAKVVRRNGAPRCEMEATRAGWLFLVPAGGPAGWLIAVGASIEEQLTESELVARSVASYEALDGRVPTAPRLAWPLSGEHWLICGSAAAGFDPICGDGTAFALREAILAAAVVKTGPQPAAQQHYATRLLGAFAKHLALCREFYASGPSTDWWRAQVTALDGGLQWCGGELCKQPAPQFRLVDSDLVSL